MASEHHQDTIHLLQTVTAAVYVRAYYVPTVVVNVWAETVFLVAEAIRSDISALQM